ncbi:MAG: FHA domain-containing protein [Magnetococcales bacterium]|nr:FHA domain-containing protein [Magnetococcales bacterium]
MPRQSIITSVVDLLGEGGRLNYRDLYRLAQECAEQTFIRLLGHWVLAGDQVIRGKITPSKSDAVETVLFKPAQMEVNTSPVTGSLTEVVYVFRKSAPSANGVHSFTMGRTHENDFVMADYAVSRTQAVIHVKRGTRFRIRTLGGSNPVYVNNRPITQETELCEGDSVAFGRFRFLLLAPSALFLRLRGIMPEMRIRQLVNALGQANYKELKDVAGRHNQDFFTQLMHHPSLVGSGVFRGYGVRVAGMDPDATQGFLPDVSAGQQAVQVKILGRSIYPLLRPERIEEDGAEVLTIGRGVDNDLMMGDDAISTRHARIRFGDAGQYFIQDLKSTNGVFVNGVDVGSGEKELFDGDKVKIGRHEFTLMFPSTLYRHLAGT